MGICPELENSSFLMYIFLTWISHLLWHLDAWKFLYMLLRSVWREACLKILI